jgi:chromosome segregation ATPase
MDSKKRDPFFVIKDSIESSLSGINGLYDKWKTILTSGTTANNPEFKYLNDQILQNIDGVDEELADLEETLGIVERKGLVERSEIESRKRYIETTRRAVSALKEDLTSLETKMRIQMDQRNALVNPTRQNSRYKRLEDEVRRDNQDYIDNEAQRQDQLYARQDQDLGQLGDTVVQLGEVGREINSELRSQLHTLEQFDHEVNDTHGRLQGATKQVNDLIKRAKDNGQMCIIIALIVVLIVLTIVVFSI